MSRFCAWVLGGPEDEVQFLKIFKIMPCFLLRCIWRLLRRSFVSSPRPCTTGCPFMMLTQSEQIPSLSCWEIEMAYSKTLNFLICLKIAMKFLLQSLCATGCPFKRQTRSSEILSQVAARPSFLKMAITSTYSAFVFVLQAVLSKGRRAVQRFCPKLLQDQVSWKWP